MESYSSKGHREFHDRLRTIELRKKGMEKAEIACAIGRSEQFVHKWWKMDPGQVPRPEGVASYLKEWCDVQIHRRYAAGQDIYQEVLDAFEEQVDGMAWEP